MTEAEKWKYHTHVYAFRIVYLGISETQRTWDGDLEGRYYDAEQIAAEAAKLQNKKDRQDGRAKRVIRDDPRNDPVVKAQRLAFAKLKGFSNWEACLEHMWQDAVNDPHPETGQPNAVGAWLRSGFGEFCTEWRDRLVRNNMAEQRKMVRQKMAARYKARRAKPKPLPESSEADFDAQQEAAHRYGYNHGNQPPLPE